MARPSCAGEGSTLSAAPTLSPATPGQFTWVNSVYLEGANGSMHSGKVGFRVLRKR